MLSTHSRRSAPPPALLSRLSAAAPLPRFSLDGRVALVTGGGRGLGAAMAQALADAGADLILWGRHRGRLAGQAARIRRRCPKRRVVIQVVDVTRAGRVRQAVAEARAAVRRIDVLINNAGIWDGDEARRLTRRQWDTVLETDLTSVFFVSQAVAPAMLRRGYGKIINIASTSGVLALPHGAAYGSAKAALIHLTRILAVEWGPGGIRVVGVAPGLFRTDMTRDLYADTAWRRRREAKIPLRRFGEPDDLAGLAVFLASAASDHITGQTIIIDGGASLTV